MSNLSQLVVQEEPPVVFTPAGHCDVYFVVSLPACGDGGGVKRQRVVWRGLSGEGRQRTRRGPAESSTERVDLGALLP